MMMMRMANPRSGGAAAGKRFMLLTTTSPHSITKTTALPRSCFVSTTRTLSSTSKMEKAKVLNESLQRGLQTQTASSSTVSLQAEQAARQKRMQQGLINGLCSFMVVLLAAQSLKAGTERKNTLQHLQAATEVLNKKKKQLQHLTTPTTAETLADLCIETIKARQEQQHKAASSSWFKTSDATFQNDVDMELRKEISKAIHDSLVDMVGDSALTQTEKEQREVQKLVEAIESPHKSRVFSI